MRPLGHPSTIRDSIEWQVAISVSLRLILFRPNRFDRVAIRLTPTEDDDGTHGARSNAAAERHANKLYANAPQVDCNRKEKARQL